MGPMANKYEKVLNVISHQKNANLNYSETPHQHQLETTEGIDQPKC